MRKFIPLSVPNFNGNEIEYVTKALKEEWVSTAGKEIDLFESNISSYVGSLGAVACQSGTAGLHIGLKILGVSSGFEVIVPALTFIAAVNPVMYLNASPVFMDCDESLCIDANKIEKFCKEKCDMKKEGLVNKSTGKVVKAIVVVHIFGNLSDMDKIMRIARMYNLKVIEDATEALGSYYKSGKYMGKFAGTIGDIGVYSFNGNKIITTGGGGMIVSNSISHLNKAKYLTTQAKDDDLRYIHNEIGYNYRMTNLQAALGNAQLEQLDQFIETKQNNYFYYKKCLLDSKNFRVLDFKPTIRSNYWFYSILIKSNCPKKRDEIISLLHTDRIQTRPIWELICDQLPYQNFQKYEISKARYYVENIINIPCSSNLKRDDIDYVISSLKSV